MFTKVNGVWSFLGVSLALIALYLVLNHSIGFQRAASSTFGGVAGLFRVLQGR